jgi:tyrosine phenol-lyase
MLTRIEPYRVKAVEPIPFTSREEREAALADAGFNLFRLPARMVTIDLLTDSGFTAMSARQWSALLDGDEAYAGSESFYRFEREVVGLTGYPHVIPTHQGRAAERLLSEALVKAGDVVPGNTHFDTTRTNLERMGAIALDLPVPAAQVPSLDLPFKGDMDVEALSGILAAELPGRVPFAIVTVTSNSCGGQPVSLANLREVRQVCDRYGVPLFLDAARFAENVWLLHEREERIRGLAPRAIARAIFAEADGCLMSAKKDGLVNIGGFLAVKDQDLADRLRRDLVVGEGFPTYGGLAGRDLEAMAVGLREVLEPTYLADRIAQVRAFGDALHRAGVPTVRPAGGHAIYLDSRAFAPHVDALELPGHSIACELYLHAGVRSSEVGQLMRGRPGSDGTEEPVELDLVRLAVPRRVYTSRQLEYVAEASAEVFARAEQLRGYEIIEQPAALRHFGAVLRPKASVQAKAPAPALAGVRGDE